MTKSLPRKAGGSFLCAKHAFIQLAVMQRKWYGTFSEHSYGFSQRVSGGGKGAAVYRRRLSLGDRVNHDKLMAKIAVRVNDKRMLKLIRTFLTTGVMEDGCETGG